MRGAGYVWLVLAFGACSSEEPTAPSAMEPSVLTDLDPDPEVVEVRLVAGVGTVEILEGKPTEVWGYRDGALADTTVTVPGPLLEVSAGDQVIVHFDNELPEDTTIHWHGIRLDAAMDGTPSSQVPVPSGGSFEYRFRARDPGLFWYHPHVRGDVQIERGLYAPLLVRGGIAPEVAAERIFVLDDVKIDAGGGLNQDTTQLDMMLGRQGNVLLVNGRRDGTIRSAPGARERWRFVNAANGRFFRLALPGHSLFVIGTDGGGLPEPYQVDSLLVAPGERYDVVVTLSGEEGATLALQTLHYDRGHDVPDPGPLTILSIELRGAPLPSPPPLPTSFGDIEPIAVTDETAVERFVLSEIMEGADEPSFYINGERWPDATMTEATLGDTAIWEVVNEAEMDHPFHLHGMFFQVLDQDGVSEPRLATKDTVVVRQGSTLRFAVTYTAPGMWMYHCHILEHAERGMMGHLMVGE